MNPSAQIYSSPLALTGISVFIARSWDGAHHNLTGQDNPPLNTFWSGPTQARFTPYRIARPGDLVVTEIHYHPPAPTPSERALNTNWSSRHFEFIETRNRTNATVDFFGARFTKGIDFNFATSSIVTLPPNGSLLLVSDRAAFAQRYGNHSEIAGVFEGELDDAGETLRLENVFNQELFEFGYNDNWYPVTDGLGYSLVQPRRACLCA